MKPPPLFLLAAAFSPLCHGLLAATPAPPAGPTIPPAASASWTSGPCRTGAHPTRRPSPGRWPPSRRREGARSMSRREPISPGPSELCSSLNLRLEAGAKLLFPRISTTTAMQGNTYRPLVGRQGLPRHHDFGTRDARRPGRPLVGDRAPGQIRGPRPRTAGRWGSASPYDRPRETARGPARGRHPCELPHVSLRPLPMRGRHGRRHIDSRPGNSPNTDGIDPSVSAGC